jgi:hypothetical protein
MEDTTVGKTGKMKHAKSIYDRTKNVVFAKRPGAAFVAILSIPSTCANAGSSFFRKFSHFLRKLGFTRKRVSIRLKPARANERTRTDE